MTLDMTPAERTAFLAETHVAILGVARPSRGPLTLPIWYSYEPGAAVRFVTGGSSAKARWLRRAARASLCVQTEVPPYRYVSVEGPVTIAGAPDFESDVLAVAHRYLGEEMATLYLQLTADDRASGDAVLVELAPERWLTVDYGKLVPSMDVHPA